MTLDALIARQTEGTSEDFQTLKSLIPTPVLPDIANKLFRIILQNPKTPHDAIEIAGATVWEVTGGAVTLRYLCDVWRAGVEETRTIVTYALQDIKEKHKSWFESECPRDVERAIRTFTPPIHAIEERQIEGSERRQIEPIGGSIITDCSKLTRSTDWRARDGQPFNHLGTAVGHQISGHHQLNPSSPCGPPDLTNLFESASSSLSIVRQCERSSNREACILILETFEEKLLEMENLIEEEKEGREWTTEQGNLILRPLIQHATSIKGLMKLFGDFEDVEFAERVIKILSRIDRLDGPCCGLMMQVCK